MDLINVHNLAILAKEKCNELFNRETKRPDLTAFDGLKERRREFRRENLKTDPPCP